MLLVWACSSDPTGSTDDIVPTDDVDPTPVTFDRATLLTNWADNIIVPSYQAFVTSFEAFETDFETFSNERSATNLVALQASWEVAYRAWQRVSMFEIGPAEQDGLRLNVNTYPTDVSLVENQIETGSYNFDLASTRDTKGFPALDYLLHGQDDALATFTNAVNGNSYITYTSDVIADIGNRARTVLTTWETDFRDSFVGNDGSSSSASVDRMTNDFVFYYEKFLRAGKMGIPAGVFSGTVAPNTIEAFYMEGLSNELFLEGLDAVQDFFNGIAFNGGANGVGYDDYLQTLPSGNQLVENINTQLDTARTAVLALDSFFSEIENNAPPTAMLMAYDEVQRIVPLVKTDMFSLLSIDVDFVDADGD